MIVQAAGREQGEFSPWGRSSSSRRSGRSLGAVLGTRWLEPPRRGISFLAQAACSWPSSAGRGGERSTSAGSSLGKHLTSSVQGKQRCWEGLKDGAFKIHQQAVLKPRAASELRAA